MDFRILGPLEVWDGDRELAVSGSKQRALLALLLLDANQVVSSERLVEELWGAESPESGRAALRVRVSQLRKTLPADVLETRAPGYIIRAGPDQLDLHRFERLVEEARRALDAGAPGAAARLLREADGLWRGPALADVAGEDFAVIACTRLEELRLAAVELRVEAELALGRHAELVSELRALVAEHALRERLRGQLMVALYGSGRQAEALEVYRQGREALVGELGIEPGPALRDLNTAILNQDPVLDGARSPAEPLATQRPILVCVQDEERLDGLIGLAGTLAHRPASEVILARLLDDGGALGSAAARLNQGGAALAERGVETRIVVFTSERPGEDLLRLALEQEVGLVLLDAPPALLQDGIPGADLSAVLANAPCDVALLAGRERGGGDAVLVPFGGVEHDWAAVELGARIARAWGATLRLLGAAAVPEAGKRDASRLVSNASLVVQRALGVTVEPALAPPGEQGVVEASASAGLLVVGLSTRWHEEGLGAARLGLAMRAASPVLFVRRGVRAGGLASRTRLTHFTWSVRATR